MFLVAGMDDFVISQHYPFLLGAFVFYFFILQIVLMVSRVMECKYQICVPPVQSGQCWSNEKANSKVRPVGEKVGLKADPEDEPVSHQ